MLHNSTSVYGGGDDDYVLISFNLPALNARSLGKPTWDRGRWSDVSPCRGWDRVFVHRKPHEGQSRRPWIEGVAQSSPRHFGNGAFDVFFVLRRYRYSPCVASESDLDGELSIGQKELGLAAHGILPNAIAPALNYHLV